MLKLYNTLSGKKETFRPRKNRKVNLFVCGPTVYDFSHIGHARTYIFFDAFVKYLETSGFDIFYLQNITDIDDKIISRAKEKNITPKELVKIFEKEYLVDMKTLGINSVNKYARATNYVPQITSQIKRLMAKGYAYQKDDGIYYDIKKLKDYGKLSKRTGLQAEDAVSRIDETKEKRNKGDFCLWKFSPNHPVATGGTEQAKPEEPKWKSPWGWGRPGWHIEDTAITEKFFGPQYDIHGGGRDLIFPHHEAEISQMEAISGKKPFVKYWLHTGFLTVNGQKMSKSLGNFITIKDFLKKDSSRVLRFFFLKNLYRTPVDYSENNIYQAKKELEKIDGFIEKIKKISLKKSGGELEFLKEIKKNFYLAIEDDFNTPKAIAEIFILINKANGLIVKNKLGQKDAKGILAFFKETDKFLGFIFTKKKKTKIPKEVLELVKEREKFREQKSWQKADEARKKIETLGYKIEDTANGPILKKI